MESNSDLSIIIPAYNEQQRLGSNLKPVIKYLNSHFPNHELIIVDDGSTDDTVQMVSKAIVDDPKVKLIAYKPNRGKGYAVRTGVLASHGDIVLFMDADLSTPLEEIPHILDLLKNYDIVIGSRGISKVVKQAPIHRRLASFVFDQIKYFMVGLRRFKDTQCGFKIFRGSVARQLFSVGKIDRFMFDVEILYLAERQGLRIGEMPVAWADVSGGHVPFFEGIVSMFRDLWYIRHMY